MKRLFAGMIIALGTVTCACAQSNVADPTAGAEMTGSIKEYTAGKTLVLEVLPPSDPIQFKLASNVGFADTDGKPIEATGLNTNRRVRVHYHKIGSDNVADKVTLIGQ
jgi:hypothetical protein